MSRKPIRCQDDGHEFACRMAPKTCWSCTGPSAQRQDALLDQVRDMMTLARAHGMYDAVDWAVKAWAGHRPPHEFVDRHDASDAPADVCAVCGCFRGRHQAFDSVAQSGEQSVPLAPASVRASDEIAPPRPSP